MSFLYPAFLLGALAIAVPIVLHLLRRDEAPEVPFTAVRLLRRSPIARSRRWRLRDLLLLLARVTALLLLAAAFARPYAERAAAAPAPVRIVAVDRSFSMSAPGVFERAQEAARDAIDAAGPGERVAVIAFDHRAEVVSAPGTAATARTAVASLAPDPGGTRYAPLLAAAVDLAGGAPATLAIVSDLQRAGWEDTDPAAVPDSLRLELHAVEPPAANLAIVDLRSEPDGVVASLRNTGDAERSGTLRLSVDGREVAAVPYRLAAGGSAEVAVAHRAVTGSALEVSIDDPDGYAADNVRYAVAGQAELAPVLIVTGEAGTASGFFLARALAASAEEEDGFEAVTASGRQTAAMTPEDVRRHAAVVLLSTRGLDRRARESLGPFVQDGGGLVVAASPEVEPQVLAMLLDLSISPRDVSAPLTLGATDPRHPVFRPFGPLAANLGQVRFRGAWHVDGAGWEVAASFSDGSPALLERRAGAGRIVLFASDLDRRWNDFPLHPSFVPFAIETIRHAAGDRNPGRSYLVHDAPAGVPPTPGVHRAGDAGRLVTVNVDPRESATTRMPADEFHGMVETVPATGVPPDLQRAQEAEDQQDLWKYGLLLMLAALVLESAIGRTR